MSADSRNNGKGTGKGRPPKDRQFQPGNPGRPKGSRNKLGEAFITALHADFEQHGADVIARVRQEDPAAYMRICASILPKEVRMDSAPLSDLSDDELAAIIELVRSVDGSEDDNATPASPPRGVH